MTVRMYSTVPVEGFRPVTLSGHRDAIVRVFVHQDNIYSVARDGACYHWTRQDGEYKLLSKHLFKMNATEVGRVRSCTFHRGAALLVVGFTNGSFGIYEVPSMTSVTTLSVTSQQGMSRDKYFYL